MNGPLASSFTGTVAECQPSPDGQRTVYRLDRDDGGVELFSVRSDWNWVAAELSLPGESVAQFWFTADGSGVLYSTPASLRTVPSEGGQAPITLAGTAASDVLLLPDESTVVFLSAQQVFRVPLDGSSPAVRISDPAFLAERLVGASGDGARVAYRVDTGGAGQVCSSLVAGTDSSTDLTPALGTNDELHDSAYAEIVVALDQVVYQVRVGAQEIALYHVPIDGSAAPARLDPGMVRMEDFAVASDGSRVVFRGQETTSKWELFSVPPDRSSPAIRISGSMISAGDVLRFGFAISPDDTRVVYGADQEVIDLNEVYVVPIDVDEPTSVKLNAVVATGSGVDGFCFSGDGQWVAYRADHDQAAILDLYSAPLDGSATAARINTQAYGSDQGVDGLVFSESGDRVVFTVSAGARRLFAAPRDGGGSPVTLDIPMTPGGSVQAFFAASADLVVFLADREEVGAVQVYSVPADLARRPRRINEPLPAVVVGDVGRFRVDSTGQRVAYIASERLADARELFSVPLDRSAPPLRLNPSLSPGGQVHELELSPDGQTVVYLGQEPGAGRTLYSVPIDGSAPAIRVADAMPTFNNNVTDWVIAEDRVVYLADLTSDRFDLFSAPIDGSAAAVRLDAGTLPAGDVLDFVTRSGHVLYRADHVTDNVYELFSVPADGSSPPVRLNDDLIAAGDVEGDYGLTPDGTHAVYRADRNVDSQFELFAVPVDRSAPPTTLNGPLPAGGRISDLLVADDAQVVYRGVQDQASSLELYRVLLDGTGRVKLNTPVAWPLFVDRFAAPSGLAVFTADQDVDGRNELYSVPLDGSASPVVLSGTMPPSGDVDDFLIDPSGAFVLYAADQATDEVDDLFSAPIDGSAPPVRLTDIAAGDALRFGSAKVQGARVLFRIDDVSNQAEFYTSGLGGGGLERVNDPLPAGAGIFSANWVPGTTRVVYLGDQLRLGRDELFVTRVRATPDAGSTRTPPAGALAEE